VECVWLTVEGGAAQLKVVSNLIRAAVTASSMVEVDAAGRSTAPKRLKGGVGIVYLMVGARDVNMRIVFVMWLVLDCAGLMGAGRSVYWTRVCISLTDLLSIASVMEAGDDAQKKDVLVVLLARLKDVYGMVVENDVGMLPGVSKVPLENLRFV